MSTEAGRVSNDDHIHAITQATPAHALCGAGIVVQRYPGLFVGGDLDACETCTNIVRGSADRQ